MSADPFDAKVDAAVTRIIGTFPELESANLELLRDLLAYAWVDGYREWTSDKARALEAQLILWGADL